MLVPPSIAQSFCVFSDRWYRPPLYPSRKNIAVVLPGPCRDCVRREQHALVWIDHRSLIPRSSAKDRGGTTKELKRSAAGMTKRLPGNSCRQEHPPYGYWSGESTNGRAMQMMAKGWRQYCTTLQVRRQRRSTFVSQLELGVNREACG